MTSVFADTYYWIALLNHHDQGHAAVRAVSQSLRGVRLVTTEEVLTEMMAYFAERGRFLRQVAVATVETILDDPEIEVHPQTHQTFLDGLNLYRRRLDKGYSLIDCISMATMRREGIAHVLTSDSHFAQEQFILLL